MFYLIFSTAATQHSLGFKQVQDVIIQRVLPLQYFPDTRHEKYACMAVFLLLSTTDLAAQIKAELEQNVSVLHIAASISCHTMLHVTVRKSKKTMLF